MIRFLLSALLIIGNWYCAVRNNGNTTQPVWLDDSKRDVLFSSDKYLKGYALNIRNPDDNIESFMNRLIVLARKELLESIRVQISNTTTSSVTEENKKLSADFHIHTKTRSDFDITNIVVEKYYNPKTNRGAVFAYARRADVITVYVSKVKALLDRVQDYLRNGNALFVKGGIRQALQNYAKALPLLDETQPFVALLVALGDKITPADVNNTAQDLMNAITTCTDKQTLRLNIIGSDSFRGKFRESLPVPLQVQVQTNNYKESDLTEAIPLIFVRDTDVICKDYTNEKQIGTCYITTITNPKSPQYVKAQISLTDYLKAPLGVADLPVFKSLASSVQYTLYLEPVKVFVESETYNSRQNKIDNLADQIKFLLSDYNFVFTDNRKEASFLIRIKASPDFPDNQPPIFFAFLGSSLSLYKTDSGEEIYKNAYRIKGVGIDNEQATQKAYQNTFEKIKKDLLYFFGVSM